MPTQTRNLTDNEFYHVYNRGNHKDAVFHEAFDYERFLWTLRDSAAEHLVSVAAYCLMPNHFHLLLRQEVGGSVSKCLTSLTLGYVKYYNRRYAKVGHLFQDRYQHRHVRNGADLLNLSRYIHRNPIDIELIDKYPWSSYLAYLGASSRFCEPTIVLDASDLGPHGYAIFCDSSNNSELSAYCVTK